MSNPEFIRNVWLEVSVHRFILMTLLLAAIFTLVGLIDPNGLGDMVARTALVTFVAITMIWGAHVVGESVLGELRAQTWDAQRMSAIRPWPMTWGKLLGGPLTAWYGGFVCLIVYLSADTDADTVERLRKITTYIAAAILFQALGLNGALLNTRFVRRAKSMIASWASIGILALIWVYFNVVPDGDRMVSWFGYAFNGDDFMLLSLLGLAGWAVFGAYRTMCAELAVATTPWAWSAFIVYLAIYFGGIRADVSAPVIQTLSIVAATGLLIAVTSAYIAAFGMYRDPLVFRRLRNRLRGGETTRVFQDTPLWIVSLSIASLFAFGCVASSLGPAYSEEFFDNVGLASVAILFYAVRDIALLYFFALKQGAKRPESTTIVTLALLWWLLPAILEALGFVTLSWLFVPPMTHKPVLAGLVAALQAGIVLFLVARRYRQNVTPRLPAPPVSRK